MKSGPILVFDCFGVFCGDPMVEFFRRHYGPDSAPLKDSFCDGADLGNVSFNDVIRRMHDELGLDIPTVLAELKEIGKPNLDMIQFVKELRKTHPVYLLSNCMEGLIEHYFEGTNFFDCFDKMYRSYELKLIKPYPEIYQYVMEDLHPAVETFFFDDNPRNLPGAENAGMTAVVFEGIDPLKDFLAKKGIL